MGTNPEILEAQIGPLRAQLAGSHEFVYLAGERECDAAQGVAAVYPGPYLCYYSLPTFDQVADAHELVLDFIDDEGPFDAVIAFSQGAALASSLMLRNAKDAASEPLFQLAIFICASLPFDLDAAPVVVNLTSDGGVRFYDPAGSDPRGEIGKLSGAGAQSIVQEFKAQGYSKGLLEDGMQVLRRFHPNLQRQEGPKLLMGVPTVHIVGKKDGYLQQSLWLAEMGGTRGTVVVDHEGGHEVPRDMGAVRKISRSMQDAVEKARFRS